MTTIKNIQNYQYTTIRLAMLLASAPFPEWSLLSSRPTSRAHDRSLCQGDPTGRESLSLTCTPIGDVCQGQYVGWTLSFTHYLLIIGAAMLWWRTPMKAASLQGQEDLQSVYSYLLQENGNAPCKPDHTPDNASNRPTVCVFLLTTRKWKQTFQVTSYTKRCQQCVVPNIHHGPCILTPHTAGDQIYGAQSRPGEATMTGVIATPYQVFDLQNTSKMMLVNWSRTVSSGASGHQSMMLHVNHWFITVLCWTLQNVRALPFQIQC